MQALRIDPDTTVTDLSLTETDAQSAIQEHVGSDAVDQGFYHRRALLHIHGNGLQVELPQNLSAWALASAWRGMSMYPFYRPVVVTGRTQDGKTSELDDELAAHVHAIAQTVRETQGTWQTQPPASNEAAMRELLAHAARDVAANR